jgi:hypothetical protein
VVTVDACEVVVVAGEDMFEGTLRKRPDLGFRQLEAMSCRVSLLFLERMDN